MFTIPCSGVTALHATAVTTPVTRNSSVQTALVKCFGIISKSCNLVDQIKNKIIGCKRNNGGSYFVCTPARVSLVFQVCGSLHFAQIPND